MLLAKRVRPEWRDRIPAIVHVDGTARVQTIRQDQNERLYRLLKEFDAITGVPVLLNTSFNVKGEPIVETPEDAIDCFLTTGIDYLVLHDMLMEKKRAHTVLSPVIGGLFGDRLAGPDRLDRRRAGLTTMAAPGTRPSERNDGTIMAEAHRRRTIAGARSSTSRSFSCRRRATAFASRIKTNTRNFARLLGYFRIPIVATLERPVDHKGALPKEIKRQLGERAQKCSRRISST